MLKASTELARLCRSIRPDIIHAHMMSGAVLGYFGSRLCHAPLVTTVHNSFDPHSFLMRLGDTIVAVSEAERRFLIERGMNESRVAIVINGPNLSPRERCPLGQLENEEFEGRSITTVCGLHHRKGVADLLQAFRKIAAHAPDWTLNIAGDGPDKGALVALAESLGISERVRFLGPVGCARPVLERSAIFVLASYADPCSLAVAEARFSGCAVVATAVGGTPELLGGGAHGILVRPGNVEEIAAALLGLITNPVELEKWRTRARQGSEYLTNDRLYGDYQIVYEDTIRRRKNRRSPVLQEKRRLGVDKEGAR
ncbi:MAG: glycosyltransferase [Beijerinckiaceae bacterium]